MATVRMLFNTERNLDGGGPWSTPRKRSRRPRGRSSGPLSSSLIVALCMAVALCLFPLQITAQTISTTASTSMSTSTSTSTSTATPTYSISSLPTALSLPSLNASSPLFQLSLPNTPSLEITLSICSLSSDVSVLPTVLLSTTSPPSFSLGTKSVADSSSGGISTSAGGAGYNRRSSKSGSTWEITWDKGFGNWTFVGNGEVQVSLLVGLGLGTDGSLSDISDVTGDVVVQLGASNSAPIHALSPSPPLLGDTTNTSALIFSPLLLSARQSQPSYPNYTLPGPQLTFSTFETALTTSPLNSSLSQNLTLVVVPTSSSPTNDGLDNSWCAIDSARNSTGDVASGVVIQSSEPQWMSVGGEEGYRSFWVVGGLVGEGNYTAWVRDDQGVLSAPMWFVTKEDTFPCQLVLPTSLCPSVGYSSPLSPNNTAVTSSSGETLSSTSPIQTLPEDIASVLTAQLEAFSTSLLSQACGRDIYSHVSTCLDCYSAYRDWLCRILVPQCGASNSSSSSTTTTSASASSSGSLPSPSTALRTAGSPRNADLPAAPYSYTELLPCLSTCNAVDRACPLWLGVRCPKRSVNAARSYGYTGAKEAEGDGSSEGGVLAADRWGNRWCNG